jgi:hypothetical protein
VLASGFAEIVGLACSVGIPSDADFADLAQDRGTLRACDHVEPMKTSATRMSGFETG